MVDPAQGSLFPDPQRDFARPADPPGAIPEVDSQALLCGGRELLIRHAGQVYRLSLTRSGKLILRK